MSPRSPKVSRSSALNAAPLLKSGWRRSARPRRGIASDSPGFTKGSRARASPVASVCADDGESDRIACTERVVEPVVARFYGESRLVALRSGSSRCCALEGGALRNRAKAPQRADGLACQAEVTPMTRVRSFTVAVLLGIGLGPAVIAQGVRISKPLPRL